MHTIITLAILLTSLAGIVTSVALLWVKVVRPFMKFTKHIGDVVEVIQTLPEWQKSVDESLSELRPNGGGSMKDKLTSIERHMENHIHDPQCHAERNGLSNEKVV